MCSRNFISVNRKLDRFNLCLPPPLWDEGASFEDFFNGLGHVVLHFTDAFVCQIYLNKSKVVVVTTETLHIQVVHTG